MDRADGRAASGAGEAGRRPGSIALRIHSVELRDVDDDDALGARLVGIVQRALAAGGAPAAAVAVTPHRAHVIPLGPVIAAAVPLAPFVGGLVKQGIDGEVPIAVGVLGTFRLRTRRSDVTPGVPFGMVFLEWTDCRWWQWRALLSEDEAGARRPVAASETVLRAIDGSPRPNGLGGWWSYARRTGIALRFERRESVVVH